MALWLTGLRGEAAFALMKSVLDAPVEHHDAVTIRYDNGSIGTMSGGSCHLGAARQPPPARVPCDRLRGPARDRPRARLPLALALRRLRGRSPSSKPDALLYDCDGPPNTLVDLALGKDVDNCSPGELGARTVEILDAAYRSAASGRARRGSPVIRPMG